MKAFFIFSLLFSVFTARSQTVTVEPVPDMAGFSQVRTVTVEPSGASAIEVTKPLTDEQLKADLLARFRAVSGEIASYETSLVTARKSAETLRAAIEAIGGGEIGDEFSEVLKSLAGNWVLVGNGEKVIVEITDTGAFDAKGQLKMLSSKSFLLSGYFTSGGIFGLFETDEAVVFFNESDVIWRAKSDSEILLIRQ